MPYKETITQEDLKKVIEYDPEKGEFRWLVRLSKNVPIGKLAGSSKGRSGHRFIRIAEVDYSAPRLAWLYVHGEWPGKLWFRDGDPRNIRLSNLAEKNSLPKKYDHSTAEGRTAYLKEHRRRYKESYRQKDLLKKFGMSLAEYQAKHDEQGGRCYICGEAETRTRNGEVVFLCVDHHHLTGKVRDLLCASCNFLIGNSKESIEILEKAISYLKRHSLDQTETVC